MLRYQGKRWPLPAVQRQKIKAPAFSTGAFKPSVVRMQLPKPAKLPKLSMHRRRLRHRGIRWCGLGRLLGTAPSRNTEHDAIIATENPDRSRRAPIAQPLIELASRRLKRLLGSRNRSRSTRRRSLLYNLDKPPQMLLDLRRNDIARLERSGSGLIGVPRIRAHCNVAGTVSRIY